VPKVWQNAMFFGLLGLASSEKQIPQVDENTEESKSLLEPLESVGRRPRQARYQAALRPDAPILASHEEIRPSNAYGFVARRDS
jgi:hypothetical protein